MGKNSLRKNVSIMIKEFMLKALAEDEGRGDLYSLVSVEVPASAKIIAKSDGVMAGALYAEALCEFKNIDAKWLKLDGESFVNGDIIATFSGTSHTLLTCERTILNTILHASSIATLTSKYINIIKPYGVKLLDTRKTRPHLRILEKYATRCGGATNHRMGLDDSLMLKDTHLKTIGNLEEFLKEARKKIPFTSKIEIEAENIAQAKEFITLGVDIVMLDNMSPDVIKQIVKFRDETNPTLLEASGNININTLASYAQTGVDAISSGSLIHQASWIDLSMKMD